jgi:hypothetical protein
MPVYLTVDHWVHYRYLRFSIDHRRWPEPASGAIAERWLVAMRGVMKEHWCTRFVLLTYLSPIILFMFMVLKLVLSNEFNSTSAVATSISPKGRTELSSVEAA